MTCKTDSEVEALAEHAAKFDALFARYYAAKAEANACHHRDDREAADAAEAKVHALLWEIIRCRARSAYLIQKKITIMRDDLLEDSTWVDARDRHMLESITMDVGAP